MRAQGQGMQEQVQGMRGSLLELLLYLGVACLVVTLIHFGLTISQLKRQLYDLSLEVGVQEQKIMELFSLQRYGARGVGAKADPSIGGSLQDYPASDEIESHSPVYPVVNVTGIPVGSLWPVSPNYKKAEDDLCVASVKGDSTASCFYKRGDKWSVYKKN
jgi:hypothetical protein